MERSGVEWSDDKGTHYLVTMHCHGIGCGEVWVSEAITQEGVTTYVRDECPVCKAPGVVQE